MSEKPQHAPVDFASLPPITKTYENARWLEEWAGSGVPIDKHPIRAIRDLVTGACGDCGSTNTLVIWTRREYAPQALGWGPDQWDVTYELRCVHCERFTVRTTVSS